ncbi:hypothetical protein ACRRTK_024317 [Alexandromys fortis]
MACFIWMVEKEGYLQKAKIADGGKKLRYFLVGVRQPPCLKSTIEAQDQRKSICRSSLLCPRRTASQTLKEQQNDIGNTWCECGQKTGRKANLKGAVVVTFTSGTFFTGSELRLCADARTSVRTRTDHYHQYISFSLDCDTKVHPPHPRHVNIIF